jgi:hypothetical protein
VVTEGQVPHDSLAERAVVLFDVMKVGWFRGQPTRFLIAFWFSDACPHPTESDQVGGYDGVIGPTTFSIWADFPCPMLTRCSLPGS